MSRTLTVVRHSKAVHEEGADIDRALAPRGVRDAAVAGRWLVEQGIAPDLVLVSPSRRTRETWDAISAQLGDAAPTPTIADRIYENSVSELLDVLHDADPDATSVVIVGHYPAVHDLVLTLAANATETEPGLAASYPTSGVAVLDVGTNWFDLGAGDATLRAFFVARDQIG
jgi:phosphohistidine phosphatase